MTDPPTISVVIPCYNGAKYLRETLESALAQTHPPLEVLVVDDGSTDDSAVIAESFGPPVRVIRQPNQGESVARNRGIEESQGEWVALLDADDLWLPHKLESQLAAVFPDSTATCTGVVIRWSDSARPDALHSPCDPADWVSLGMKSGCPCHISSLMIKRTVRARFPDWTRYGEDCLFVLDLLAEGKPVVVADGLTIYRKHSAGQSRRPLIACDWHRSFGRWLSDNCDRFANEALRDLKIALGRQVVDAANTAYHKRDWENYEAFVQYLSKLPEFLELAVDLKRRRLPRAAYSVWDTVRRYTSSNQSIQASG